VLDQPPGHPWHVRWLPSEDVSVSPKEDDERVFLFRVEARPDHGSLAVVACPEVDECGLAEINNLKEETRGTQFRQVRGARCVIPYILYVA
jgi:hypothetical protein